MVNWCWWRLFVVLASLFLFLLIHCIWESEGNNRIRGGQWLWGSNLWNTSCWMQLRHQEDTNEIEAGGGYNTRAHVIHGWPAFFYLLPTVHQQLATMVARPIFVFSPFSCDLCECWNKMALFMWWKGHYKTTRRLNSIPRGTNITR